jgi:uridine kinase
MKRPAESGPVDATEAWQRFARSAPRLPDDDGLGPLRPPHVSDAQWSRYLEMIVRPLAELVRTLTPAIVGLSGPPGSGKSTLARQLAAVLASPESEALALSLDDFYLSRRDRLHLGIPWRGGPGSHDLRLLTEVLGRIRAGRTPITLPRFDAHTDDRTSPETLASVPRPVLLEGWFLGYPDGGYGEILTDLDLLVFLDVDVPTARIRRFTREDALREAGGGFSPDDMRRFWDEVLEPGIVRLVPAAKQAAGLVLEVDREQRVRTVKVRHERVAKHLRSYVSG